MDSSIEERDAAFFDDIESLYKKISKYKGVREIVGDWSLNKIDEVNMELVSPYLNGKKVLEIGCGRGCMTSEMSKMADVVAFDISRGSLKYAESLGNFRDSQIFQGNVCDMPLKRGIFNVVVVAEVLEHLPKLDRAMVEIHNVIKRGGIVVASVPNSLIYFYPLTLLMHISRIGKIASRQIDDNKDIYHRPFLPHQFRRLFEEQGFEIVKHRTSMVYFWRFPYERIIFGIEKVYPKIAEWVIKKVIEWTDSILERNIPLIKWIGARQHIVARKI